MKKILVIFSLLAFVAYTAPALVASPDVAAKIVTVDKDKKKASKAKKAEVKDCTKEECAKCDKATTCEGKCEGACKEEKVAVKASCGEKNCAATCKEAASCKGHGAAATGEKK
jgi:hypothetical protein